MQIIKSPQKIHQTIQRLKIKNKKIGFIPTMGALHEGHAALLKQARKENDIVVLSIFVNPTQFSPKEDFQKYPRTKKNDKKLAKACGVDIIFYPSSDEMYQPSYLTYVYTDDLGTKLCGQNRSDHFKGVTTVVSKLLNIVTPDTLYLGQKDAQQAIILKKMIANLNYFVTIKVCSIVRAKDGLAVSSRNTYLSSRHRSEAAVLYQSLKYAKTLIRQGERSPAKVKRVIKGMIQQTSGKIDYIECVETETLSSVRQFKGKVLIALAVRFGKTRLIDNIVVSI